MVYFRNTRYGWIGKAITGKSIDLNEGMEAPWPRFIADPAPRTFYFQEGIVPFTKLLPDTTRIKAFRT